MLKKLLQVMLCCLGSLPLFSQQSVEYGREIGTSNSFSASNLPILLIHTAGQSIPDEPKITASLDVIANEQGARNEVTDKPYFSGAVGIELRGNSTQGFPKKPYNIEIRDAEGEDLAVELLGMPAESDWVLRASYIDHTFIRNPLAMHMSRSMGHWASRCQLVELMVNDEYAGIYILMEKIKRDKNRVDINKLKRDEVEGKDLTGGYIYEVTGKGKDLGKKRDLRYPKMEDAAPEQVAYITEYDDNFRLIMGSDEFADIDVGYHSVIESGSFMDEMIVQEAMRNSDAYGWSSYFIKDKEAKLEAGPVWDFDQSAGNSSYPDDGVVEGWMFEHPSTNNTPFFWKKLFTDPHFAFAMRERWEDLRQGKFSDASLLMHIDSLAQLLDEAQIREFEQWPVLGSNFWRETKGYKNRDTYQKEVAYLKDFLSSRWSWMDSTLAMIENPDQTSSSKQLLNSLTLKSYPNPARSQISFELPTPPHADATLSIYNASQQRIKELDVSKHSGIRLHLMVNDFPSGIYFYHYHDGLDQASGKFMVLTD